MSTKYRRFSIMAVALPMALVLGACADGGSTGFASPSTNVAPQSSRASAAPTVEATASQPASSSAQASAQATPGDIDPCTLLTAEEASTLMGMTLSAGVSTNLDPARACTFKSGLSEVKLILAPQAPDAATAQAYWDAERAQVPADITITDLNIFDRAAYGSASISGQSLSALFVISGTFFFDLYCGFPACTQDGSVTAAQLIVGRLP